MRLMLERFSRNKVLKRKLPIPINRKIYVTPDAQLKYVKIRGDIFDNSLLKIAQNHINRGDIIWDIGANIGTFALAAAHISKTGETLAVEADIWMANIIKKSLRLNKDLNLSVLPAAISEKNGIAEFLISGRGRAQNTLAKGHQNHLELIRDKTLVPTFTIDSLLDFFNKPSFIKIDVEGAELLVMRGATKILKEVRPKIYIEVNESNNKDVTNIFLDNNYSLYDDNNKKIHKCVFNTLAIPN